MTDPTARILLALRDGGVTPPGDGSWRARALCAQVDPELFFPIKGSTAPEARAICARCPVRAECLAEALRIEAIPDVTLFGVWGGYTAAQRRKLRAGKRRYCRQCGTSLAADAESHIRFCSDDCRRAAATIRQRAYEARKRGAA